MRPKKRNSILITATLSSIPALAVASLAQSPAQSSPAAPAAPIVPVGTCSPGIDDFANPGSCLYASSIPMPGTLLPLGPEFFVSPIGDVGLGTMMPGARLDVVGDLRLSDRLAAGNDADLGGVPGFRTVHDLSHTVTDFPESAYWEGLHSRMRVDPQIDLTGPDTNWIHANNFEVVVPGSNDRHIEAIFGLTSYALPKGTGTVNVSVAGGTVAEIDAGHANAQVGWASNSIGDHAATVTDNYGLTLYGGHKGTGGWIENDYGLYLLSPAVASPITNHYGLYLEDQEFGTADSYAIYSEGGTNYLGGELGIGTAAPTVALDVVGDFAATGTKSFVQPHPWDPSREIWFVCLEGNEAGTYFRGSASLRDGRAEIPVPEEFGLVTEAGGLTVQLTARGDARLWIEESNLQHIVVRGSADIGFDYMVNGVRAGYADFQPLRARPAAKDTAHGRLGPAPSVPATLLEGRPR